MATAKDNPTLTIIIDADYKKAEKDAEAYRKKEQQKWDSHLAARARKEQATEDSITNSAKVALQKRQNVQQAAATKATAIILTEATRREASRQKIESDAAQRRLALQNAYETKRAQKALLDQENLQRNLSGIEAKELVRRRLQYEREQERIAKGHLNWSQRMTKGIESIGMSIKGLALAWGAAQVTSAIKGSLELAGGMRDAAAGVGLSTQAYFALTSALRDAGVQAEKIDPMFVRLNDLISGGASEKQQSILDRLGINATGMTNVQLMDTLLAKINGKLITQADLGELVGTRIVPAWNRLANEITNVNEATAKYKFPLTDKEVDTLDEASRMWESMWVNISLATAKGALWATQTENALALAPSWAGPFIVALDKIIEKQEQARNSAHLFAGFLAGAQSDIEARRNFAQNGPFSLPEQVVRPGRLPEQLRTRPVDSSGQTLRRSFPTPDRNFELPAISRELPIIVRGYQQWGQASESVVTTSEMIAFAMQRIAQSNAWQVAQSGAQALNSVLSLQAQLLQNEITSLDMVQNRERQRWQERSDSLRMAGLETSALYRNEQRLFEQAEKAREAKATQLKSKAFEQEKLGRISQTMMNTATAIINAWTTPGAAWVAPVLTGIIAASSAAQIATITSQQNPYHFREGGFVRGNSGDNNRISATGGEFMVERNSASRNADALRFMNAGGTMQPSGGSVTVIVQGNVVQNDEWVRDSVIPAILKAQRSGVRVFR